MPDNRPLPAFHFSIRFTGLPGDKGSDNSFMSVSGLKAMLVQPGDAIAAATVAKYGPLVLRRAVNPTKQSPLRKWVLKSIAKPNSALLPELLIEVLNEEHQPQIVFRAARVSATGWELGELHAGKSELLIEEISLNYTSLTVV